MTEKETITLASLMLEIELKTPVLHSLCYFLGPFLCNSAKDREDEKRKRESGIENDHGASLPFTKWLSVLCMVLLSSVKGSNPGPPEWLSVCSTG